jgi:hypothetical protein
MTNKAATFVGKIDLIWYSYDYCVCVLRCLLSMWECYSVL